MFSNHLGSAKRISNGPLSALKIRNRRTGSRFGVYAYVRNTFGQIINEKRPAISKVIQFRAHSCTERSEISQFVSSTAFDSPELAADLAEEEAELEDEASDSNL